MPGLFAVPGVIAVEVVRFSNEQSFGTLSWSCHTCNVNDAVVRSDIFETCHFDALSGGDIDSGVCGPKIL